LAFFDEDEITEYLLPIRRYEQQPAAMR